MNTPGALLDAQPFDTLPYEELSIESAFLSFDDEFGRRCRVYAARCFPAVNEKNAGRRLPVVLHLPGGGQTIDHKDLAWWARYGFAAVQLDWQINATRSDPRRASEWPAGVVGQHAPFNAREQAVLPLAIKAAGVVYDWMCGHERVDASKLGLTGISWGGFLTWAVNAYEPRVRAAAPVYGCGGLFTNRHGYFLGVESPMREMYRTEWDAVALLRKQIAPVCYLSSTNDFFGYHTIADALLNDIHGEKRRSSFPNNDHHLGPGEAALAVAWFRWLLEGGPAVPREPALREDWSVVADESWEVAEREVWWTPTAEPDDMRCWLRATPGRVERDARLAFGRVRYRNGVTLNTPTIGCDALVWRDGFVYPREVSRETVRASHPSPDGEYAATLSPRGEGARKTPTGDASCARVWPVMTDGVTFGWGMRSTQFWRTDLHITPAEGDTTRAEWRSERPGMGAIVVAFRGLADERWRGGGDFSAITVEVDPLGVEVKDVNISADFVFADSRRANDTVAAPPERVGDRLRWTIRLTDFPKRPADATWAELRQFTISGWMLGNRFVLGPVTRVK